MSKHHHQQQNQHKHQQANASNGLASFPLVRTKSVEHLNNHSADERETLIVNTSPKSEKKSSLTTKMNEGPTTTTTTTKKEKKVVVKSIENLDQTNVRQKPTDVVSIKSSTLSVSSESSSSASSTTSIDRCFCFSYSYIVLIGSFIAYMLASLLSTCFGVFFENMESDLGWSKSQIAFIGGLISALQDLTGPIASALTNKFGCRKTAFFGGLIAAFGMIGSGYVHDFWLVGFLMGGVSGFGSSLVLVSSVVVVTYYFEEKPSFAAGLTISGGSLGQSIFSLIIIKLNEIYGRSGCFLILGGILLNILVCAVLFRPLKWELEEDEDEDEEDDDEDDEEDEDDEDDDDDETEDEKNAAGSKCSPNQLEKDQKDKNLLMIENKAANDNNNSNKIKAPIAKFDSSSAFSLIRGHSNVHLGSDHQPGQDGEGDWRLSKPVGYLMKSEFMSDLYLPDAANADEKSENLSTAPHRHLSEGDLPVNPSVVSLANMNPDDEEAQAIAPRRLLSYANSLISFDRCHSLELTSNVEHQHDSIIKSVKNQSVPVSLKSSCAFRSARSLSKSTMLSKKLSSLRSAEEVAGEDGAGEQLLEEGGEYVVVAAADEIEKCGSNLIISPESDIYLPDIFNENEKIGESAGIGGGDRRGSGDGNDAITSGLDENGDLIVSNEKPSEDQKFDTNLKVNEIDEKNSTRAFSSHKIAKNQKQQTKKLTENKNSPPNQIESSKTAQSGGFWANFLRKIRPSFRSTRTSADNAAESSKNPLLLSTTTTTPITTPSSSIPVASKLVNSIVNKASSNQTSLTPQAGATPATVPPSAGAKTPLVGSTGGANRKIVVNAGQKVIRLDNNLYLIKNPMATGKGSGSVQKPTQKKNFIIAKCTCKQRYAAQNAVNKTNQGLAGPNSGPVVGRKAKVSSSSTNPAEQQQQQQTSEAMMMTTISQANDQQQLPTPSLPIPNVQQAHGKQSANQSGAVPTKAMRHYPNCPLFYLNVANQRPSGHHSNQHPHHHQNHHHHHAGGSGVIGATGGGGGHKASFYHIPNLFQNSFKVPLHFRNVYYYKSLLNLNMRLIVLRPHGAGALTLRGSGLAGVGPAGLITGPHHHHHQNQNHHHNQSATASRSVHHGNHHHHHYHQFVPNTTAVLPNGHNVSLSCPDLNLKQVLVVKKPKREDRPNSSSGSDSAARAGAIAQGAQLPIVQRASRSRKQIFDDECRVLNAGSIVLLPGSEKKVSNRSSRRESPSAGGGVGGAERRQSLKLSDLSLSEFTDRIRDSEETPSTPDVRVPSSVVVSGKKQRPQVDDIQEEDEDEESESDEEDEDDEDEDDEDDDEEEECDNCVTRTKFGNYLYKYGYKPLARPLKFIYISIAKNIELFKLIKFSIFALCNFILSFFYEAPFYFINSYMIENGSTSNQAGTVTIAVGIVSVFSSSDSKKVNPIILYSVSLILCGLCCCLVPLFITNYLITMILLILIGALISVSDVLVPVICVNIVGYDEFVNAYGLMFFCQGLASFSGPPVLGLIVDKSGSYALSYYIIGVGICLSGLVLESVLCYDKFTEKKKDQFKKLDSTEKNLSLS